MLQCVLHAQVIICPLWLEGQQPILRDPKTCMKWCVDPKDMEGQTFYPQYCAGIGYIVSQPVIPLLYNASRSTPFFWIDDVYVTGLLVKKLTTKIDFVNVRNRFTAAWNTVIENYNSTNPLEYYFGHAPVKTTMMTLWKLLLKRLTDEQKQMINVDALTTHKI